MKRGEEELAIHPDKQFSQYVVNGIRNGFHVGFQQDKAGCGPSSTRVQSWTTWRRNWRLRE